ncbi:MAG: PD-(D/E)XK nuclease family protein [candidate division WOR-3 bacterium]|nr:MAG: PD-(D/E)XK nuclease family protein [candidate division WOR-3 bacterium]
MPATENKIKVIPIEQPFLRVLAQYVYNKFKGTIPDFSDILIIFPSQRNKFYFRRYLLEASKNKGIIPPTMKTIAEVMNTLYEMLGGKKGLALNRIERNYVLKSVVDSLKVELWRDLPFLRFIAIGDRLLGFFDELAKERVTLDAIEEKILAGHYPEKYVHNELPIMKRLYEEYRKRLAEHNYLDTIDLYDTLSEQYSSSLLQNYMYIIIAGLVATTTVENKIIKEILENLPAELILHSTQKDIMKMDTTDKPFYPHYKLLHAIEATKTTEINGKKTPAPAVFHIKRTETESQQTFYLGTLLRKLKEHDEPHRIAIILTDETNVYSITETLNALGVEFNLSVGFPLIQSILYSFLSQLHILIEQNLHYQEFFAFIKHPLFKNAIIDKKSLRPLIYDLQQNMTENQFNYFDHERYRESKFAPLVTLVKQCVDTVQKELSLNEYIESIIEMLNTMLRYNYEFLQKNTPDITEFFDRIHNLTKLRIPEETVTKGIKMLEFILHILKEETFNLQGDPMKGIQVIGFLEARNLDFDCIILPSMNEGIFPRRSEKDLFINQPVRKEIGLPYDKERENLYYYYFTEMTNGKKEVFISFIEEEKRDIRSRFIDFLLEKGTLVDETKMPFESTTIRVPTRTVKKDHDLFAALLDRISRRGLSPTNLKDYQQCPYRFYLRYVLNIQEPKEIVEEAGPLEWGRIIHKTLSSFYKYDFPKGVTQNELASAKEALHKRLHTAVQSELAHVPRRVMFLDEEIYKRRLDRLLELDIERFESGFKIDKDRIEKSISGEIEVGQYTIGLYGYPDRVDMLDHEYYIIDYKSSKPAKKTYKIGEDFSEFQLPLYSLIISNEDFKKVHGMAYFVISKDIELAEIVDSDSVEQYLIDFREQILIPTIKEILDPTNNFSQTDNQDNCTYCAYTKLCGVKSV